MIRKIGIIEARNRVRMKKEIRKISQLPLYGEIRDLPTDELRQILNEFKYSQLLKEGGKNK